MRLAIQAADLRSPADVTLRIAPVQLEIAPGRTISTVGYNGTVPGPLVRFREGVTATVDLFNDTDDTEFVHWHGFDVPANVDGAEEENSLAVPPHGRLRYRLIPVPSGCRYVHTHAMSMSDLNRGTFTGQFGVCAYRTETQPGALRPGDLSGDARMGSLPDHHGGTGRQQSSPARDAGHPRK